MFLLIFFSALTIDDKNTFRAHIQNSIVHPNLLSVVLKTEASGIEEPVCAFGCEEKNALYFQFELFPDTAHHTTGNQAIFYITRKWDNNLNFRNKVKINYTLLVCMAAIPFTVAMRHRRLNLELMKQ